LLFAEEAHRKASFAASLKKINSLITGGVLSGGNVVLDFERPVVEIFS
jgi:hypothetical protein